MKKKENIILVYRTGGDFSMKDVKLISERLVENSDINIKVWCLTDIISGDQVINMKNVTLLPLEYNWPGWWSKINMFSPKLEHLRPFLFMDLDTIPLKPISCVFRAVKNRNDFIMIRIFSRPGNKGISSFMWIPANDERVTKICETFKKSPDIYMKEFKSDQEFINSIVKEPDAFWQDLNKGIVPYRVDERFDYFAKEFKKERINLNGFEDVVIFYGKPRIWQAANKAEWVKEYLGSYFQGNK